MRHPKLNKTFVIIILCTVSVTLLYCASSIVLPILFSIFAALGLANFANKLEKIGLNRFLGALVPTVIFSTIFFGVLFFIVYESYYLINEITVNSSTSAMVVFDESIEEINSQVNSWTDGELKGVENFWDKIVNSSNSIVSGLINTSTQTLSFFIIVPIYIFFMLNCRFVFVKFIKDKYESNRLKDRLKLIDELGQVVKQYLKGMGFVILIITSLNCLGLWLLDIPYAIALGILSGALTIIPYIGVFAGGLLPLAVAYTTGSDSIVIWSIIGIYTGIQFIEGNFITPNVMGKTLSLNPLVIIVSTIIMGSVGGILAIILTIPVLASVKVFLEHSKNNKSYAILLGND